MIDLTNNAILREETGTQGRAYAPAIPSSCPHFFIPV
jgi:hypothetical protein